MNYSTLAEKVVNVTKECTQCFSLYAGYGNDTNGNTVRFPQGVELSHKVNSNGRCIRALYRYADGSHVTFTWSDFHGVNVKAH
jgi:hypothetical protein